MNRKYTFHTEDYTKSNLFRGKTSKALTSLPIKSISEVKNQKLIVITISTKAITLLVETIEEEISFKPFGVPN